MNIRNWLRHRVCPSCIEVSDVDHHPSIGMMERSADALDRLATEVRRIREQMADGPNPLLGEPPIRPERKDTR